MLSPYFLVILLWYIAACGFTQKAIALVESTLAMLECILYYNPSVSQSRKTKGLLERLRAPLMVTLRLYKIKRDKGS